MGIYEKLELGGASPKPPSPRPKPSQPPDPYKIRWNSELTSYDKWVMDRELVPS